MIRRGVDGRLARVALALTAFAERWLPDAFVFALAATVAVFVAGLAVGVPAGDLVTAWGDGFPDLLAFAMQMALVIVTGYVVATARPVRRAIAALARIPSSSRGAVAFVTAFAMASSWINWGFSLVFSAVLARAVARRFAQKGRRVDYRALGAASLLGLGSVWAQGLSGSAALQMATPSALPPKIRAIIENGGVIPGGVVDFTHTILLWQSLASVAIELVVVTLVMWLAAPAEASARDAATLGIVLDGEADDASARDAATLGIGLDGEADDAPARPPRASPPRSLGLARRRQANGLNIRRFSRSPSSPSVPSTWRAPSPAA